MSEILLGPLLLASVSLTQFKPRRYGGNEDALKSSEQRLKETEALPKQSQKILIGEVICPIPPMHYQDRPGMEFVEQPMPAEMIEESE